MKICYYLAISADGFIADSEGGVDWLSPFQSSEQDYGFSELMGSVDGIIMGRRTYDQALTLGDWPYGDMPSWVWTTRPIKRPNDSIHTTTQSPVVFESEHRQNGFRKLWMVGGANLASQFHALGLITDYIFTVLPVLLGKGISPLEGKAAQASLVLTGSTRFDGGVIQNHYQLVKPAAESTGNQSDSP